MDQEVVTGPLRIEQLRESVPEIIQVLRSAGHDRVNVTYGWGCNLPQDKLWHPTEMKTQQLDAFIERSERQGIFDFGRSDLYVEDPEETLEFTLCHESDIHFASSDESLVAQVITLWRRKGFTLYVSEGPWKAALRKEWKRIE